MDAVGGNQPVTARACEVIPAMPAKASGPLNTPPACESCRFKLPNRNESLGDRAPMPRCSKQHECGNRRELRRGSALVAVEPQVFDLLQHLIRHRDRVVSKDDLLASIWYGRIVSESALLQPNLCRQERNRGHRRPAASD